MGGLLLRGAPGGAASARGRGDGGTHPKPAPRSPHGPLGTRGHKKKKGAGPWGASAGPPGLAGGGSGRGAGLGSEERLATRGNPRAGEKPAWSRFVALPQPPGLGRERLLSPRSAPWGSGHAWVPPAPASCQKSTRGATQQHNEGASPALRPPANASIAPKIPRPYCTCPGPALGWLGSLPVTCCHRGIGPRGRGRARRAAGAREAEASLAQHGRASSPGAGGTTRKKSTYSGWVDQSGKQGQLGHSYHRGDGKPRGFPGKCSWPGSGCHPTAPTRMYWEQAPCPGTRWVFLVLAAPRKQHGGLRWDRGAPRAEPKPPVLPVPRRFAT